jgi:rhamnose transport system permease protein
VADVVRRFVLRWEALLLVLLGGTIAYGTIVSPYFLQSSNLFYISLNVGEIAIMALPLTLIVITGEIDLSVASILGLSGVLMAELFKHGWPIWPAMIMAVVLGAVLGGFNGFLVTRVGLPSLAVTIGTLALYRGIAVGLLGTTAVTDFPEKWTDMAKQRLGSDSSSYPLILVPFVVLLILFALLLHFSPFGRGIFEIGLNDEAAHFTGVNVARTKLLLFVLAGAVSAFAGVYYTLRFGSARGDNASGLELQVIAAVLLGGVSIFGGRGALHGVVAGVLLIGVISSAMRLESYTVNVINIVIGVLLVLSVMSTSLLAWVSSLRPARTGADGPSAPSMSLPSSTPGSTTERQQP